MGSTLFCYSINPSPSKLDFTRTVFLRFIILYRESGGGLSGFKSRRALVGVKVATALVEEEQKREAVTEKKKKSSVLFAGGGIRGLVFALAAKKKGFDVLVFEKDSSAIRGEGQYRGLIQIQSNALAALEAIDIS